MKFWDFCHEHPVLIAFFLFCVASVAISIWGH